MNSLRLGEGSVEGVVNYWYGLNIDQPPIQFDSTQLSDYWCFPPHPPQSTRNFQGTSIQSRAAKFGV